MMRATWLNSASSRAIWLPPHGSHSLAITPVDINGFLSAPVVCTAAWYLW